MLTSLTLTASLAVPYLLLAQLPQRSAGRRVAATALNAWRTSVYELPDGRVLAVDSIKRLVLLDSNLSLLRVVVDSVPTRIRPPWPTTGFLIPYENGGVAYVDGVRPMFSQILGDSVIAANRPLPRTDLIPAIDHIGGRAAFDSSGRLVYAILRTAPPAYWRIGDSAYLAAIDSRRPPTGDPRMLPQKTITAVAELYHVDSAGRNRAILANDLWAVVGGTIVVLRADGRTIEKWSFDGVRLEVVKLPGEPRVLSMAEKRHIVDSVRTMAEAYKARHPEEPVVTVVVDPSELPDTLPAFRGDPPVVDLEGRLWVIEHPLATKTDSTVALVIDVRTDFGHILERRMLPPRRKIGGFGNRSIYLWQSFGLLERYIVNR